MSLALAEDVQASIRKPTNIPAQPLGSALASLAKDREFQVLYRTEVVGDTRTSGASGELTIDEAMRELLAGTGLSWRFIDARTVKVFVETKEGGAGPEKASSGKDTAGVSDAEAGVMRLAQAESREATASGAVELEEVIVSATKRLENVQDIPMSIAVIGNQEIERRGLIGMQDYLRSIPGVSQIDQGPLSNAIVIRGISTSPQSENYYAGTTVASYFDETPITGAAGQGAGGIDVRPVDIERIELLRGPQGTAYGSASLGGTLRIIPAKPKLDAFGAKVAASYSGTSGGGSDNSMFQGVFNMPLVQDKLAVRAVGYRYDESGFYRNVAGNDAAMLAIYNAFNLGNPVSNFVRDDIGHMLSTGARLAAAWKPTEDVDLTFTYLTQKIEQDGAPEANTGKYEQVRAPIAAQARVRGELEETSDTDIDLVNAVLNYRLGWATWTSAVSRVESGSKVTRDFSASLGIPASSTGPSEFKSFTVETRLSSELAGRFQFLAGLFYEKVEEDFLQTIDWPGLPATSPVGTNPMYVLESARDLDQRALFGEVSYDLTETLTATVGGRVFKYEKDENSVQEGGFISVPLGTGAREALSSSQNDSTFKAHLQYEPTDSSMLYASWAQGFRLGRPTPGLSVCDRDGDGLVDGTNIVADATRQVDSDSLDNYELGGKFSLFERRMTLDTAVYHIRWKDIPLTTALAGCRFGYTANAGGATSDGVELQASVHVTQALRIDLGGGYTKARLSDDAPGLGSDGDRLPGSPKINGNLSAQYDFDTGRRTYFVRGDAVYVGKFYGDLQESPERQAGNYVRLDARAGVGIGSLTAEVFVRNLTNEDAYTWRGLGTSVTSTFYGYRLQPRTVGVQLGYAFD
jgi:outer membrane receptor protein involved in Fe transport